MKLKRIIPYSLTVPAVVGINREKITTPSYEVQVSWVLRGELILKDLEIYHYLHGFITLFLDELIGI